jgi:hypothetical protein
MMSRYPLSMMYASSLAVAATVAMILERLL